MSLVIFSYRLFDWQFRAEVAISFDSLWLLAQEHMSKTSVLHELPPEVLRYLTQALVLAGSVGDDTTARKKYLDQVSNLFNWKCLQYLLSRSFVVLQICQILARCDDFL